MCCTCCKQTAHNEHVNRFEVVSECVVLVSDAGAGVSVSSGPQCRGVRVSGALRAEPLGVCRSWLSLAGLRLRIQTVCRPQDRRERDAAALTAREYKPSETHDWV